MACSGHGAKASSGKDLDVATVTHLGLPPRAASHRAVERARLPFERQNEVAPAAWFQDAGHLTEDQRGPFDMLAHIEDPDELELTVAERPAARAGDPETA